MDEAAARAEVVAVLARAGIVLPDMDITFLAAQRTLIARLAERMRAAA